MAAVSGSAGRLRRCLLLHNALHRHSLCKSIVTKASTVTFVTRSKLRTGQVHPLTLALRSARRQSTQSLDQIQHLEETVLTDDPETKPSIPTEGAVLNVLHSYHETIDRLSKDRSRDQGTPSQITHDQSTATSSLLDTIKDRHSERSSVSSEDLCRRVSLSAISIIEHPNVFISPAILKAFIALQSKLNKPQSFPHVFRLYRDKPLPRPSRTEPFVTYERQWSSSPSTAVDSSVATEALAAAIRHHDLQLALSIVEETFGTGSFIRAKLIRTALLPATGAALLPFAAYQLATRFAGLQETMDEQMATGVAMAGIVTYAAAVGTMGYVALTTSNDQMQRVTWATGMPLWERWVREDERAAVELVTMGWGFKKRELWGDEQGPEWDTLKEWAGVRGMIIDRVSLMDGME